MLVTGAAGFIGSYVVERLLAAGHLVVGVDAFTGYFPRGWKLRNLAPAMGEDGFRLVEGDLLTLNLRRLLRGSRASCTSPPSPGCAGVGVTTSPSTWSGTCGPPSGCWRIVRESGTPRFVHAFSSVDGLDERGPVGEDAARRPASPYGLSKLAAEELVGLYGRERGVPADGLALLHRLWTAPAA